MKMRERERVLDKREKTFLGGDDVVGGRRDLAESSVCIVRVVSRVSTKE